MSTSDLVHRDLDFLEIPQKVMSAHNMDDIMLSGNDEQGIVNILFARVIYMRGIGWEISCTRFWALPL